MSSEAEWKVELPDSAIRELQRSFDSGPISDGRGSGSNDFTEFLVRQVGGLKVEVFANEHPPPHFRVKYNGETANFRISDCSKLNGGLNRWHRNIREWHRNNKRALIKAWDDARPDDCPVGKYREN